MTWRFEMRRFACRGSLQAKKGPRRTPCGEPLRLQIMEIHFNFNPGAKPGETFGWSGESKD